MSSSAAPLVLEDLHVAFGGNRVLEGVDLDFSIGFNGLIGPNGAGKTTVFNVLSGYVRPTQAERSSVARTWRRCRRPHVSVTG